MKPEVGNDLLKATVRGRAGTASLSTLSCRDWKLELNLWGPNLHGCRKRQGAGCWGSLRFRAQVDVGEGAARAAQCQRYNFWGIVFTGLSEWTLRSVPRNLEVTG